MGKDSLAAVNSKGELTVVDTETYKTTFTYDNVLPESLCWRGKTSFMTNDNHLVTINRLGVLNNLAVNGIPQDEKVRRLYVNYMSNIDCMAVLVTDKGSIYVYNDKIMSGCREISVKKHSGAKNAVDIGNYYYITESGSMVYRPFNEKEYPDGDRVKKKNVSNVCGFYPHNVFGTQNGWFCVIETGLCELHDSVEIGDRKLRGPLTGKPQKVCIIGLRVYVQKGRRLVCIGSSR